MEIGGKVLGGKNFSDRLAGIFAPITTPFTDGSVDYRRLGENIEKYNTTGLKGYMLTKRSLNFLEESNLSSNTSTWFLPPDLALYSAISALRNSSDRLSP